MLLFARVLYKSFIRVIGSLMKCDGVENRLKLIFCLSHPGCKLESLIPNSLSRYQDLYTAIIANQEEKGRMKNFP